MNSTIAGQVAQVVNSRELVINRGLTHGVKEGMIFSIREESALIIIDPETNEEIGGLDREKVRVRAVEVQENMSICKTYRVFITRGTRTNLSSSFSLDTVITQLYGKPDERKLETLRIEDSRLPPPLSPEQSLVKRGDRAVELRGIRELNEESKDEDD